MQSRRIVPAACLALCLLTGCAAVRTAHPAGVEAESGRTTGRICGPSQALYTFAAEASGRRCVRLEGRGDSVEVRAPRDGDAVVVRYCLSDVPGGRDARMTLWKNGRVAAHVPVTSRRSWVYGAFPWSENPADGKAHAFFDEVAVRVAGLRRGDVLRLEKTDRMGFLLIDLLEIESVPPPRRRPPGSLSIEDFGAVGGDGGDDSSAVRRCLAEAVRLGRPVWVPAGEFRLDDGAIPLGRVRLSGAGMWHSRFGGRTPFFTGTGRAVRVADLAVFGEVTRRIDASPDNAFHGNFGRGSRFVRLWIEHVKCGFWTTAGTRRMRVIDSRIRNTMADGLNFCDGTSDSSAVGCSLRNTGDDALATWSPAGGEPCRRNVFLRNTIQLPWHASGIALYGGERHLVRGNTIDGTVYSGAGILVSSGFASVPFRGAIRIRGNRIAGCGGECYIGQRVGSLWIHAKDSDIRAPLSVRGLTVERSSAAGISIHGPRAVENLMLDNIRIHGVAGPAVLIHRGASGRLMAGEFFGDARIRNDSPGAFAVRRVRR